MVVRRRLQQELEAYRGAQLQLVKNHGLRFVSLAVLFRRLVFLPPPLAEGRFIEI